MGVFKSIKRWFTMKFKSKAQTVFNIQSVTSGKMESAIRSWSRTYDGFPDWLAEDEAYRTINFAQTLCEETARLATLGIGIKIEGQERAKWLQEQIEKVYYRLRQWVEYGCAFGTIILKPNGEGIDFLTPDDFIVTGEADGKITNIVFVNRAVSANQKKFYTRLEYHRYEEDGRYVITNKCYVGTAKDDMDETIDIIDTPWRDLTEEVSIENTEPLFGVLKMPKANNIDYDSSMGMAIFSNAMEELRDLDIAYSLNSLEVEDSKRTVLLDSDRLVMGGKVKETNANFESQKASLKLPRYIKNVYGNGDGQFYQEINPTLNTETRIKGINNYLSQIGYKVGYSNGYFSYDEKQGIQTATGVEANDRRTIQLIKDIRDQLESCINGLVSALSTFADLYNLAPVGKFEVNFDFGDITYNYQEDKATWWGYVLQGYVPAWKYFSKFENMTEEEAKEMADELKASKPELFKEE